VKATPIIPIQQAIKWACLRPYCIIVPAIAAPKVHPKIIDAPICC